MAHPGQHARLGEQAARRVGGRRGRLQELEGDVAVELRVVGLVDVAVRSFAELPQQDEATPQVLGGTGFRGGRVSPAVAGEGSRAEGAASSPRWPRRRAGRRGARRVRSSSVRVSRASQSCGQPSATEATRPARCSRPGLIGSSPRSAGRAPRTTAARAAVAVARPRASASDPYDCWSSKRPRIARWSRGGSLTAGLPRNAGWPGDPPHLERRHVTVQPGLGRLLAEGARGGREGRDGLPGVPHAHPLFPPSLRPNAGVPSSCR